jgi:hypothetical protein
VTIGSTFFGVSGAALLVIGALAKLWECWSRYNSPSPLLQNAQPLNAPPANMPLAQNLLHPPAPLAVAAPPVQQQAVVETAVAAVLADDPEPSFCPPTEPMEEFPQVSTDLLIDLPSVVGSFLARQFIPELASIVMSYYDYKLVLAKSAKGVISYNCCFDRSIFRFPAVSNFSSSRIELEAGEEQIHQSNGGAVGAPPASFVTDKQVKRRKFAISASKNILNSDPTTITDQSLSLVIRAHSCEHTHENYLHLCIDFTPPKVLGEILHWEYAILYQKTKQNRTVKKIVVLNDTLTAIPDCNKVADRLEVGGGRKVITLTELLTGEEFGKFFGGLRLQEPSPKPREQAPASNK